MEIFNEENFAEKMRTDVSEFLKTGIEGDFASFDGQTIHYTNFLNAGDKGSIVISHGFCEFFGKYHEVAYEFYQMGYSVFFINHRGHGYSHRDVPDNPDLVHIDDFDEFVEDMKCFLDKVVRPAVPGQKLYLFAHSMGGCIGALFLEKYTKEFDAAILSSPMIGMNLGKAPLWMIKLLVSFGMLTGKKHKFAPGNDAFDGKYIFDQSCCQSEARYAYSFEMRKTDDAFRTYGASYGWMQAALNATKKVRHDASRIQTPVLLFQAGLDDLVLPEAQDAFLKDVEGAKKEDFADAKHEIYNGLEEDRKRFYTLIADFFAKY